VPEYSIYISASQDFFQRYYTTKYIVTRVSCCLQYLLLASPEMESEAEHGSAKSPDAVQVKLNGPSGKVTVLVEDTTVPLLSVHW